MNGKSKCKILKDIRRAIAEENDIAFVTSECKYQGDCSGTCPKCEAEVRYLEAELAKRQKAGKAVAVAGIAAALLATTTGCSIWDLFITPHGGAPVDTPESQTQPATDPTKETLELPGSLTVTDPTKETLEIMGEPAIPDPTWQTDELMGDVPVEYVDDFGGF